MSEELELNTDDVDSDQAEAYIDMFYTEDEAEYLENSERDDVAIYNLYGDNSSCNTPLVHDSQLSDPGEGNKQEGEDEGGILEDLAAEGTGVDQHITGESSFEQKGDDSEGGLSGDQES